MPHTVLEHGVPVSRGIHSLDDIYVSRREFDRRAKRMRSKRRVCEIPWGEELAATHGAEYYKLKYGTQHVRPIVCESCDNTSKHDRAKFVGLPETDEWLCSTCSQWREALAAAGTDSRGARRAARTAMPLVRCLPAP